MSEIDIAQPETEAVNDKDRERDKQQAIDEFHEAYQDEIDGFMECELEVFLDEMADNGLRWPPETVLMVLAFISQHGTGQVWSDKFRRVYFNFNGRQFWLTHFLKGRTPVEIAWMLYKVSDEERGKDQVVISRIQIAMTDNPDVADRYMSCIDSSPIPA